ncbi:MAG: hypothetical protein IPQ16_14155 [Geobacteraceae bacterium]|nr:hypothetical protein [Geobacteraceae bacterium]
MKRTYLHLLVFSIIICSAAPVVAAGKGGGASSPVQNRNQNQVEQREMYQHREHNRDGQKLEDAGTTQGDKDRLRDRDRDQLKDLDQDQTRDQLKDQDRDRLQVK